MNPPEETVTKKLAAYEVLKPYTELKKTSMITIALLLISYAASNFNTIISSMIVLMTFIYPTIQFIKSHKKIQYLIQKYNLQ